MTPEPATQTPTSYAAFRLRFRAYIIDGFICLGIFLVGGIVAGILLEGSDGGRVAAFVAIALAIVGYEPYMVWRYGGTFGHQKCNIRVVRTDDGGNLPFGRALVRSLIKQTLGLASFILMFVSSKAQGFHDLAVDAKVVVLDLQAATSDDRFQPPPQWVRKVVTFIICFLALSFLASVLNTLAASSDCRDFGRCSDSESSALKIIGLGWLVAILASLGLAVAGRLPGCGKAEKFEN